MAYTTGKVKPRKVYKTTNLKDIKNAPKHQKPKPKSDFKIQYGKKKTPNQTRGLRQTSSNTSIFGAFSTILFIVLFMLFTTTISELRIPTNTEATSVQGSTDYIREIAPTVGENSTQAIASFFVFTEGLARVVESIVTNFGTIANAIVNFFQPQWLFGSDTDIQQDLGNVCIAYEDLDLARRTFVSATYGLYRFAYFLQNPEYTTVEDYWNFLQFRDYDLVCS
jgi:hypothetical protein